jgi:hypothetical protein
MAGSDCGLESVPTKVRSAATRSGLFSSLCAYWISLYPPSTHRNANISPGIEMGVSNNRSITSPCCRMFSSDSSGSGEFTEAWTLVLNPGLSLIHRYIPIRELSLLASQRCFVDGSGISVSSIISTLPQAHHSSLPLPWDLRKS